MQTELTGLTRRHLKNSFGSTNGMKMLHKSNYGCFLVFFFYLFIFYFILFYFIITLGIHLQYSYTVLTYNKTTKFTYVTAFLVLRKLLFVSFCVVVWVLFSVFSIFCITSLVSATPRNHQIMGVYKSVEARLICFS